MRVLSGIQPTGNLHIGNYLGAGKQYLQLQQTGEFFLMVVDLHALTVAQDPKTFAKQTMQKVIELLALGIDPAKTTLFVQSHVPEHVELAWIFNTLTPVAELERMTQYKDKSKKNKKNINIGLLSYPVLQAADVLLYKPEQVPVGKDQVQHLELTRTIAKKFNAKYGNTFPEPATVLSKEGAKIMSLLDPKKKMSKSDGADAVVSVFDEPAIITKKFMKATTDTGKEIKYNTTKKPGISNLLTIYALFADQSIKETEQQFKGKGYAVFKKATAQLLIEKLEPMRRKKKELDARELYIKEILKQGAKRAHTIAETTMQEVREKTGLLTL
jgi:tryptophanyl-tRNA synthetase